MIGWEMELKVDQQTIKQQISFQETQHLIQGQTNSWPLEPSLIEM